MNRATCPICGRELSVSPRLPGGADLFPPHTADGRDAGVLCAATGNVVLPDHYTYQP